jgi:RNA 3'-terminal phosphate cyclase (GTP)
MLQIDGSSGGGQILRTALALSVLTQQPFTLDNIRKDRPQPGLREQHLQGLLAIVELCEGEVSGAELDATKVVFTPGKKINDHILISIRTAGSIGLILQTLLPIATRQKLSIKIKGGATHGKFAPPIEHFTNVLLPLLEENIKSNIEIHHYGFYPKGGARVDIVLEPKDKKQIVTQKSEKIIDVTIFSLAAKGLRKKSVCERQAESATTVISGELGLTPIVIQKEVDSQNLGSSIQITLKTNLSFYGGDKVGELGKRAELIGESAGKSLIRDFKNGSIDIHTADMLVPFLALCGGEMVVPRMSNHITSNIKVTSLFLGDIFVIDGLKISSKGI